MDEILKDKVFWTKEKFREKKKIPQKSESVTDERHHFTSDEIADEGGPNELGEEEEEEEIEKTPKELDAFGSIENKVIGLYFSANWCVSCQEFTSLLRQTYDELKERASPFEIIFISFDKKLDDMKVYFTEQHGDWLAVPHKDSLIEKLKTKYDIKAIPKLIVIRDNGTVITEKGRKDIQDKGMICFRGWLQKANLSASIPSKQSLQESTKETDKDKTVSFDV